MDELNASEALFVATRQDVLHLDGYYGGIANLLFELLAIRSSNNLTTLPKPIAKLDPDFVMMLGQIHCGLKKA